MSTHLTLVLTLAGLFTASPAQDAPVKLGWAVKDGDAFTAHWTFELKDDQKEGGKTVTVTRDYDVELDLKVVEYESKSDAGGGLFPLGPSPSKSVKKQLMDVKVRKATLHCVRGNYEITLGYEDGKPAKEDWKPKSTKIKKDVLEKAAKDELKQLRELLVPPDSKLVFRYTSEDARIYTTNEGYSSGFSWSGGSEFSYLLGYVDVRLHFPADAVKAGDAWDITHAYFGKESGKMKVTSVAADRATLENNDTSTRTEDSFGKKVKVTDAHKGKVEFATAGYLLSWSREHTHSTPTHTATTKQSFTLEKVK